LAAVAESSAVPSLPGLAVTAVEWLPSGAESGLVRVRGRWSDEAAREPDLPVLALRAGGADHRFDSLPDARFSREPDTWRGTYLVPAELVATDPEALWLEWPSGARAGLGGLSRGVEPPPVPAAPERPEEPDEPGGQVIDRAVLAERRARRAEAAEQAQARVADEALKAVEVLELRSAELERRLDEAIAERDALSDGGAGRREALAAALASAAALRSRSREWQVRMRTTEVARAGDAVRLAVLEAERATGAGAIHGQLAESRREAEVARREATTAQAQLAAAGEAAATARADLEAADQRFAEAHAAWDRRREELEAALTDVRAQLDAAREEAGLQTGAAADARADAERLRGRIGSLEAALAVAEGRIQTAEAAVAAAETRLRVETVARTTLEDELDREREARDRAELALAAAHAEAERTGTTLQERIAELERRAAAAPELERVAQEHAAGTREVADTGRLVADLDAAADALRRRGAPADEPPAPPDHVWSPPALPPEAESEPPAPDAEPATEWADRHDDEERAPIAPGVQPRRTVTGPEEPLPWTPPGFEHDDDGEGGEPPAPDAEPSVESAPPVEPSPPEGPKPSEPAAPPAEPSAAPPPEASAPAPVTQVLAPQRWSAPPAAPPAERPAGPVIVSASGPPARSLAIGTERRDYPLLRGALVKLAHDDAATAAALLVALLPAQGAVIEGPLAYDLTIREAGTFAVAIAGGRASAEQIDFPRPRGVAAFHLTADAVILSELLAGVEHRVGRFFGPARFRGRKRRLRELQALPPAGATLTEAARAGARLDPALVYRLLTYAVHPTWTRGHDFTIAQAITGAPPETWYLTAADGAGVSVSGTAPDREPDATVTMSRETFDRLLRQEPVGSDQRPVVHGDHSAVAAMHAWTERVQGRA
jgi:hypothetical protein